MNISPIAIVIVSNVAFPLFICGLVYTYFHYTDQNR